MEGLNLLGQEEYIWAMRHSNYRDEEELLEPTGSRKAKFAAEPSIDDRQTKVMASLVPDEVIYNVNDYSHREYDACFLFGDVSGFTELCEKYTKTGVSGPSRMTQVLNRYLGSMVQEVMSHNGDVLKFSGDAFLAIFKSTETESMRDAVHEALDCALVIQKNYGSYLTDVGVVIRVKLAISAGLVTFALIGDATMSHYVVVGKPIWDVKAAEHISSAGDIIVAPAAWRYINANEYLFQDMPDKIHVKITGVGPNWRSVQKNIRQEKHDLVDDNLSLDEESMESDSLSVMNQDTGGIDEFSLRPAVNTAVRSKIKEALRRFINAPVMNSIDKDEPFEYLTEMRQAVIVFINVISKKLQTRDTVILADNTYKAVCSVVEKMKGCVNKVSLFDKDLMFVVIFGLRGLKHELECQIALRCARKCHTAIQQLPGVLSTSIGVTTGKTYCGVFGHTLRREYTVISLIVNKAARLMVNYKGKVTCDRETFLHSKLEAKHFILQEHKPLKGISHPGPVYEFIETEINRAITQKINARPLLGRTDQLKLYHQLLETFCKPTDDEEQHKMLLVQGEARQGKTRLLDEFAYTTPVVILVNRITLNSKDQKVPYQTIRLIFNLPLNLTLESSIREKKDKISKKLRSAKVPELICALNVVFGVNFKTSSMYSSLKENQKIMVIRKVVKQLATACFVTHWVHAIDDCEFVDDASWEIFSCLFDVEKIFFVATKGKENFEKFPTSPAVFDDPRVKTVFLNPIERRYLGALACQLLDVFAISPELENAIQTRSNGNPGWVDSFLISSLQDKALFIIKATLRQIHDLGLVCPPLYMMARLNKRQTYKWQHIMEERQSDADSEHNDYWERYIDSCRDSRLNVKIRAQMEAIPKSGTVPICVVSPNFSVGDGEVELSMDAMILKTFDSLNYFEQLLVKCSSILGNQFYRDMLLYVMNAQDTRKASKAVQKLFEIRVLTCAAGDFMTDGSAVFQEQFLNPIEQTELVCQCRGNKIDDTCQDLPRYASCGYLQFRSSQFHDITYNLLTDNQKKEFHHRAIRYIERETNKCKSCGFGLFERFLGARFDQELLAIRAKTNKNRGYSDYNWDKLSRTRELSSTRSTTSVGSGGGLVQKVSGSILSAGSLTSANKKSWGSRSQLYLSMGPREDEKTYSYSGLMSINRLKNSFSLTRAFSTEDFTDCQCNLILSTAYTQLIEHCLGANELSKVIEVMLEYAYLCIHTTNIPRAMKTLDEVLEVVKRKSQEKTDNMWKFALIRAKIYTLMGYSRLELGHHAQARDCLYQALAEYGITFPTGTSRKFWTGAYRFKQFVGLFMYPACLMKNLDHWETVYANNLSECLSLLCTLFKMQGEWKNADLAANWSFTEALHSFSDFRVICVACANMIETAQYFGRESLTLAVEVFALNICHFKKRELVSEDIKCVARLYSAIFTARIYQAQVEKAIHMGYIVTRLCNSVHATNIILPVLPYLMHILLIGRNFNNVNAILQELTDAAQEDIDTSGKVWRFALSLGLQIETGYTMHSYNIAENFYNLEGECWTTMRDPDARKRFFAVMWLWCIRTDQWEAATVWSSNNKDFLNISEKDSFANKISALYVLEGMLLTWLNKMDRRNIKAVIKIDKEIDQLVKAIERGAEAAKLIKPRLYHLKAYRRYIRRYDSKVDDLLVKATKYAERQGNLLEVAYIEHSSKAWSKTLSAVAIEFWKDHSEAENASCFQDLDSGANIGFFTLPTPMYM